MPCAVAVRPTDEYLSTSEVIARIRAAFEGEDVVVFPLPVDIASVNYGRGVGYEIIEHVPPTDVAEVSATRIREQS